jgi:hypothetical protein
LDTLVTKSLLLLTFVATLLALRGETWDKNKRGLSKLSTTGWFIAFLSFSAMCLTWYWQDKQEADERSARDRSLSDLLHNWMVHCVSILQRNVSNVVLAR